jgi:glycosyltransferase involved in cell wall biosynthesis
MADADGVGSAGAVAVVIPAYQAGSTVRGVVAGVRAVLPQAALYVVDDGSTDGTAGAAAAPGVVVMRHERNRGKGAALADGVADGALIIITLDADGQHPPAALPQLLAPLGKDVDLVLGARARAGAMPLSRRFTNWLSATVASRIGAGRVPDAQTGLRAFSRTLAQAVLPLVAGYSGYDYEAAFLLAALRGRYGVRSVAIPTIYDGQQSHFRSFRDGWRVARVFARYLLGAS